MISMVPMKIKTCCPPRSKETPPKPADPTRDEEELAGLARALAHPARVRILRLLGGSEACVCGEIVEVFPLAQSTVSQHLKVLREAGLILGEEQGTRVCYCLNGARFRRLKDLVAGL